MARPGPTRAPLINTISANQTTPTINDWPRKSPLIATLTFVIFCALTSRSIQLGWIFIWVQASSGIPMVIYFGDPLWVNTCVGWVNQHSRDHFLTVKGALRHSHLPRDPLVRKEPEWAPTALYLWGKIYLWLRFYNFKSAHKQHSPPSWNADFFFTPVTITP